ncbi:MAG: hypothetical protein LC798_11250 [Chloroflexi bacterium]|nr:hypothetical protein [Chloroflexota bacterium]
MTHGLGRLPAVDPRDNAYPIMALTAQADARPEHRYWDTRYWGDQGAHPHCVGYAWTHWLEMGPVGHPGHAPVVNPVDVYDSAQFFDEWPGNSYDGTSVRAGAKVLHDWGFIESYLWAFDAQTVMDAVLGIGPVVVGSLWTDAMFTLDAEGFIYYRGSPLGGHAYVVDGANARRGVFRIRNSWSRSWGRGGRALIDAEDLGRLIADDGEAALAVERVAA